MIPCISVENMRHSDEWTIAHQVPSLELMYRAAYGVFLAHDWKAPVAIVAGSGNNGGDGFALACILKETGVDCTVFTLSHKQSADSAHYAALAEKAGAEIVPFEGGCLNGFNTVVDCLLGTGFQGAVRDNYRAAIEEINRCSPFVVSVDINSGMNGDTGGCEIAVKSDLTVTIGFVKQGLVTENAGKYMKKLVCADIGITLQREENHICGPDEWQPDSILCPLWLDMEPVRTYQLLPNNE